MLKAGADTSSQIGMVTAATPCNGMLIARAIETSNLSQCFIRVWFMFFVGCCTKFVSAWLILLGFQQW